ncbi:hypothetical protein [Longirhabdus pacifica]|uniref:hypothetical protein n=1 Tax=Longirhabdus pacifica TaxID=2305227 RepID=UPI001008FC97|nr:hypothetical protein [Longirhabdus pacifica]
MSQANIPNITPIISITVGQTVPLLLASIALEELALAHVVNAEAEKIQFALKLLEDHKDPKEAVQTALEVNEDVRRTLRAVIKKELLLEFKLENVIAGLPIS